MNKLTLVFATTLAVCSCTSSGSSTGSPAAPTGAASALGAGPGAANAPTNFVAHLAGANEIPPRDTSAQGQVTFQLDPSGAALSFRLVATNIDNVVAAHIHVGAADVNGPVVAFLFGNVPAAGGRQAGVLNSGTITSANLVGSLAGQPLSALIDLMKAGSTYTNVHTNDGVGTADSGPGDFPGGEIRGQNRVAGAE
jgi:hypothetical protein